MISSNDAEGRETIKMAHETAFLVLTVQPVRAADRDDHRQVGRLAIKKGFYFIRSELCAKGFVAIFAFYLAPRKGLFLSFSSLSLRFIHVSLIASRGTSTTFPPSRVRHENGQTSP